MPVHDWSKIDAGIFHAFQHGWITELSRALNRGLLPADYYPLPEMIADAGRLDVFSLPRPSKAVVIRHVSNHRVVAVVEIVSPGNKNSQNALRSFVTKAIDMLRAGVHLLILDILPPGERDPQGIHKAIWDELVGSEFTLPIDTPLTLSGYRADQYPEAFLEFAAVGDALPEMPLFLSVETYVPVPLEATYRSAFDGMPGYWREVLDGKRVHR